MKLRLKSKLAIFIIGFSLITSTFAAENDSKFTELDQSIKYEQDNSGMGNNELTYYNPYQQEVVEDGKGISKYGPKQDINMSKKQIKDFYASVEESNKELKKSEEEKLKKEKKLELDRYKMITISIVSITLLIIILLVISLKKYFNAKELKTLEKKSDNYESLEESISPYGNQYNETEFDFKSYLNEETDNSNNKYQGNVNEDVENEDLQFDYKKYINGDD